MASTSLVSAGDDPARALLGEVAQRERGQVVEQVTPQPQDDPLAETREAADDTSRQRPAERVDGEVDGDVDRQRVLVALARCRRRSRPGRAASRRPARRRSRPRSDEQQHERPAARSMYRRRRGEAGAAATRHAISSPNRSANGPPRGEQVGGRAVLDDPAVDEHGRAVGQREGRQALRGDQHGAARERRPQAADERALRMGVDGRERVVEHEHAGVRNQRAGERHALALAAGEVDAALADQRVVAVRQLVDEVSRRRPPRRPRASSRSARRAGRRVRFSRRVIENRIGRWVTTRDVRAQLGAARTSRRSTPPDRTRAGGRVVEARQQVQAACVLPAPVAPQTATISPGSSCEVDAGSTSSPSPGRRSGRPRTRRRAAGGQRSRDAPARDQRHELEPREAAARRRDRALRRGSGSSRAPRAAMSAAAGAC